MVDGGTRELDALGESIGIPRYNAFLRLLGLLGFSLAALLAVSLLFRPNGYYGFVEWLLWSLSLGAAFIVAFGSMFCAGEWDFGDGLQRLHRWQANNATIKARIVTSFFFVYLLALTFVVAIQGAAASPFSSMLLLNAGFGYFFANKPVTKRFAIGSSLIAYLVTAIIYASPAVFDPRTGEMKSDAVLGIHWTWALLMYGFVVLFVVFITLAMERVMTKAEAANASHDATAAEPKRNSGDGIDGSGSV